MSLPDGAVLAPGARTKIEDALKALAADQHAPREVQVNVILHIHHEYPKHVVVGKTEKGEPVTKVGSSPKEEAAAVKAAAEADPTLDPEPAGDGVAAPEPD